MVGVEVVLVGGN